MSSCPISELIIIGSILICTWASLRFADAQRCSFVSLCFDGKSLRGSCWRTQTSSRGQPWGLIATGFLSLGEFNWGERWLVTMDMLWHTARSTDMDMQIPDFLFPKMGPEGVALPWQPMTIESHDYCWNFQNPRRGPLRVWLFIVLLLPSATTT